METAQTESPGILEGAERSDIINMLKEINISSFLDKWGPVHVLQVYDPELNIQGILVIDNVDLGPACGGIRISPRVTPHETFQRARSMTWACALADAGFGGGAAAIKANPSQVDKASYMKAFARGISFLVPDQFVAAPDVNVGKEEMAAFVDEIGDRNGATGKPEKMHGIPHELGVTGLGIGVSLETILKCAGQSYGLPESLANARIAINGFENSTPPLIKYLNNKGAKIVAVADHSTGFYKPSGLDAATLLRACGTPHERSLVRLSKEIKRITARDLSRIDCDVVVSNASEKVRSDDVRDCKAKCYVEGCNSGMDGSSEHYLTGKKVLVLPDIVMLSGAAVASYAEFNRMPTDLGFALIESRAREIAKKVAERAVETDVPLRRVAIDMASQKISDAMERYHD